MDPPSDKLWSFQDLRNASNTWNMKGDKALLEILQNIHNNVLSKATNTTEKLNTLSSDISSASISLMNINNKFTSLGNTQFIENKVQDYDESIEKPDTNNESTVDALNSNIQNKNLENLEPNSEVLSSLNASLDVLEGLCEKFHISTDTDSGSDDSDFNDINSNIILRPKDVYVDKPLPYIIGSDKWQKNWHLGMQECTSDSDSYNDEPSKKDDLDYSSSDDFTKISTSGNSESMLKKKSQMTLPITKHNLAENEPSMTSSSTNNSTDAADSEVANINIADNTIPNKPKNISDMLNDNVNVVQNKPPPQTLVKASDFAAELAKKLGGNVQQEPTIHAPNIPREVSKENKAKSGFVPVLPIESTNRVTGNIFLDEPPPMDAQSSDKDRPHDNFIPDNEDEIASGLFGDEPSSMFHSSSPNDLFSDGLFESKKSSGSKGLFDEPAKDVRKKTVVEEKKPTTLFDDDDDEDDFGIFNTKLPSKNLAASESVVKEIRTSLNPEPMKKESNIKKMADSIFDDLENSDDDLFGSSNYFKNNKIKNQETDKNIKTSVKEKSKSLFDDISDSDDDLFNTKKTIKKTDDSKKPATAVNEKKVEVEAQSPSSKPLIEHKSEYVETKTPEKTKNIEKSNDDLNSKVLHKTDNSNSIVPDETPPKSANVNALYEASFDVPPPLKGPASDAKETKKNFNDYDDEDDDDLFGSINRNRSNIHDDLFSSEYNDYSQSNKNVNIFSDEPPDLDEPDKIPSNSNASLNWDSSKLNDPEKINVAVESDIKSDEQDDFLNILPKKEIKPNLTDDLFTERIDEKVKDDTKSFDSLIDKNKPNTKLLPEIEKMVSESKPSMVSESKPSVVSRDNKDLKSTSQLEKSNSFDSNKSESDKKTQKPIKKLQSNVNINVKALMPTSMPKSVKEIKNSVAENVSPPKSFDEEATSTNEIETDDKADTSESTLCNNILKERAKIKVKRRPSSRKARHEAIRKSAADIYNYPDTTQQSDEPANYKSLPNSPEKPVVRSSEKQNENKSNSVSTGNVNSDDLFGTDKKVSIPNIPSKSSVFTSSVTKKDLFSDDDDDIADIFTKKTNTQTKAEIDVFAEKSQQKPPEPKKPDKGLFGDSDSDSELFSKKQNSVVIPKTSAVNPDKPVKEKNKYESIFDESDDEDLFTSKKPTVVNKNISAKGLFEGDDDSDDFDLFKTRKDATPQKRVPNVKPDSSSNEKPPSKPAKDDFQDPLSMFLNE